MTTETPYTEGTLIIDAYRASKPEKHEQQIQNTLNKMGSKWDKILKNEGE